MERRTDIRTIDTKVKEIIAASTVARHVKDVKLVTDMDGDGDEFIRVEISLRTTPHAKSDELRELKRQIWDAVDALDERFASVRFPDAA